MEKYVRSLKTQAWKTMGARYNAARRLKRRDRVAAATVAAFSAISVGVVIVQKTYAFADGSEIDNFLTALSACIALSILVVSLMEWGAANAVKAEWLHKNAEELNAFQRKLDLIKAQFGQSPCSWSDIDELRSEYESIKERCPYNHEPLDLKEFEAQHWNSAEFMRPGDSRMYRHALKLVREIRSQFYGIKIFILCWVVVIGLVFVTPWEQRSSLPAIQERSLMQPDSGVE